MTRHIQGFPKDAFERVLVDNSQAEKISKPSHTFWHDAWLRIRKNKAAIVSMFILIFFIFMAFVGPYMVEHDPENVRVAHANLPPKIPVLEKYGIFDGEGKLGSKTVNLYKLKKVEEYYWFGTDSLGRDLFSRVWKGTQISLYIAFIAAVLDMIIGVIYGGISGYYGGRVDDIMQRIVEVLIGIPTLVIVILMIMVMDPGIWSIIFAIAITGWINMSRIVRGQVLRFKHQEFVLAAKTLGASDSRIIKKHLLPNIMAIVIINTMFTIPTAIFFEAFLSFIGLGLQAPKASLGTLINDGYKFLEYQPHMLFFPAFILSLLMIAFNLIGDGLRDAFDPKMKD